MFFLIYKIIPNKRVHFKSALQAALFAGLLWELAKHLFAWYIVHLAEYSIFYGSLSTLVIVVLWVYYSSMILVVGGEFAYFLEEDRQRSKVLTRSTQATQVRLVRKIKENPGSADRLALPALLDWNAVPSLPQSFPQYMEVPPDIEAEKQFQLLLLFSPINIKPLI